MNFNNPFSILNSSNINNLNLKNDIHTTLLKYIKDLQKNNKKYNDFDYFVNTRLKDYDLPNHINQRNLSSNYFLHLHGSTNDKKGFIKIPKNVYIIRLENNGNTWGSLIINYLIERMKLQNDFSESFIKSIMIETSLLELFKLEEIVKNHNKEEILNNPELYIQKYFKVYKHNDKMHDFNLQSEEKHNFYSGLFKLPAKSYIAYQEENVEENPENNGFILVKSKSKSKKSIKKEININSNSSMNANTQVIANKQVISHRKIKDALLHPTNKINQDIIHKLLYPSITNIRIENNDYYTIHSNYLMALKANTKFGTRLNKMGSFKRNLSINVRNMRNENKTKVLSFKNILQKIILKVKPTNEKPLILFCNFCTSKEGEVYYPQNNIIKNENIPLPPSLNEEYENSVRSNLIYLDFEKYVLNEQKLTKNQYLEEIQRMVFDLHLADAIQNVYINKIDTKIFRSVSLSHKTQLLSNNIENINMYINLIKESQINMEQIKNYEEMINYFYKSKNIIILHGKMNYYKRNLYELFLENNINKIERLCVDILHETQRLFNNMKKSKIYYNSKKHIFKEINYFYNTFYPSKHFFSGNCTYAYTFIQYLLFIVYAHTRKVIKSLIYHSFENVSNINNSNNLNIKIKDDYISRIIDIHYKRRNKKIGIISYYDSILYNVIRDLHKIYTNNNVEFGVYKRQFKSLLADLGDYYDLYLKNNNIYENIGNLSLNFVNPEHIFENRNYNEYELNILENRRKNKGNVDNGVNMGNITKNSNHENN